MSTICVSDVAVAQALTGLKRLDPDLRVLMWADGAPKPAGIEEVDFFVPLYPQSLRPPEDLSFMPKLKVVQALSAGVEEWLQRVPPGAILANGRGLHGASTAELAFAGILSHIKQLPLYAQLQRDGVWLRPEDRTGLRGRRVLVLGAGDIGHRVAAAARIFEADVTEIARTAREGVLTMAAVPDLLPTTEVLVIALPNTTQTAGVVDAQMLAALPDGALVVNIARGSLLDTDALLAELTSKRLYAFLDVFPTEPLPPGDPLWTAPNVVITPHIGGGTVGWDEVAAQFVYEQVERYLTGQPLLNIVRDGY